MTVIDLSAVESPDPLGHFKSGASPAVVAFVRALRESGGEVFNQGKQRGLIEGSVAVIQRGTDIVLAPLGGAPR